MFKLACLPTNIGTPDTEILYATFSFFFFPLKQNGNIFKISKLCVGRDNHFPPAPGSKTAAPENSAESTAH